MIGIDINTAEAKVKPPISDTQCQKCLFIMKMLKGMETDLGTKSKSDYTLY